jgi:hypothetical protein
MTGTDKPTPSEQRAPAGRPPVHLAQFGDVMTDRDLAALLQMSPSFARKRRELAARTGLAPNLPAAIPGMGKMHRYLKQDVERWLLTGSSSRHGMRRVG